MGPISRCDGGQKPPARLEGDMAVCSHCGRTWLARYPNGNVVTHLPINAEPAVSRTCRGFKRYAVPCHNRTSNDNGLCWLHQRQAAWIDSV